ncbi:MAG: hypothetical protein PHR14_09260 [Oscillospiraceae bacterium]|nr:hypothetical protein [Oscillospiraceae bacterium]
MAREQWRRGDCRKSGGYGARGRITSPFLFPEGGGYGARGRITSPFLFPEGRTYRQPEVVFISAVGRPTGAPAENICAGYACPRHKQGACAAPTELLQNWLTAIFTTVSTPTPKRTQRQSVSHSADTGCRLFIFKER